MSDSSSAEGGTEIVQFDTADALAMVRGHAEMDAEMECADDE